MSPNRSQFDNGLSVESEDVDIVADIYSWIKKLSPHYYKYIVAHTRRASNLVELVQIKHPDTLPQYITENGLLLQAEDIVDFYVSNGAFPKIAVLDDVLVYGRNMNLFLTQFWNTVCQCPSWQKINLKPEMEKEEFCKNIHLWIYGVNDAPILLRHDFLQSMHHRKMMPESKWRRLSDSIAKRISAEDIANTSYVISAKLGRRWGNYRPASKLWISEDKIQYRKNRQNYRFYLFCPDSKTNTYLSVRSYEKSGNQYFTPYFFMPELRAEQMLLILEGIFDLSERADLETTNKCINLLNRINECSSRLMVYAQFAILLLSQITLSVFLEQLNSNIKAQVIFDTEKISRNFGFPEDIIPILDRFCGIEWKSDQLVELLDDIEFSNREDMTTDSLETGRGRHMQAVDAVERLIYKQAIDHERDAYGQQKCYPFDSSFDTHVDRTGEQELNRFLFRVKKQANIRSDAISMLPVLSILTQMMDLGDISLKARYKVRDGSSIFYSSVRTTEMSLAIMPRKLGKYYPAFFSLAQFYWRDQDFPNRVEQYFRDMLFDEDMPFDEDEEIKYESLISDVRYFAQMIAENRMIVDSMLNWKSLPEFSD